MFKELKVLELASVLAGPSVGQFFAELGAQVIKVENPRTSGDVTRSWLFEGEKVENGISSYFSSVNWGKKSITLDILADESRAILRRLIEETDIIIASFKPGDDRKLGVDYDSVQKIKPDVIYGHITGYGPEDARVGYDAVIQAESGFMTINGEKGQSPLKMPVALMDILAAHHLKEGLLLALIQRMTDGNGSYVPVSLMDAAVSSLANQGANWLVGGKVPGRTGNEHPNIAPYGDIFETADGQQIMLAIGNDKQFAGLCEVLQLDLSQNPEFQSNQLRVANREPLRQRLASSIKSRASEDLLNRLNQQKVPAGCVKSIDEVLEDGESSWFHNAGELKGVRNLMGLPSRMNVTPLSPPPQLGQHTEEIINSLKG